jgi:hypothetical protein
VTGITVWRFWTEATHCGSFAALGRDPMKEMGGENGCELPIAFLGNEASVR